MGRQSDRVAAPTSPHAADPAPVRTRIHAAATASAPRSPGHRPSCARSTSAEPVRVHHRSAAAAVTRLAPAARGGDAGKTDLFLRALHQDVWSYVAHLGADAEAADDLTQDVFRHDAARPLRADREDWRGAAEQNQPHNLTGFEEGIALYRGSAVRPACSPCRSDPATVRPSPFSAARPAPCAPASRVPASLWQP